MKITYYPKGTCSTKMEIEEKDGVIRKVKMTDGCSGNLQGISRLLAGMPVEEAISRLEGIRCGKKPTSCPDQLSKALRKLQQAKDKKTVDSD